MKEALKHSNSKTSFIISSPPQFHYEQIKLILDSKHNIYVEKPIFINSIEAVNIQNLVVGKDLFVTELLMYKYTMLYEKFLKIWNKKKNSCIKIECFFNIPCIPKNTFRDNDDIFSSPLYDIGCYIFSLMVDLNISLKNLKIQNVKKFSNQFLQFYISGISNKLQIYAEFGIGKEYNNLVRLIFPQGDIIEFEKFFYGRYSEKNIIYKNKNKSKNIKFFDENGFENIFKYDNKFWLKDQKQRFTNIIKVNKKLNSLANELCL